MSNLHKLEPDLQKTSNLRRLSNCAAGCAFIGKIYFSILTYHVNCHARNGAWMYASLAVPRIWTSKEALTPSPHAQTPCTRHCQTDIRPSTYVVQTDGTTGGEFQQITPSCRYLWTKAMPVTVSGRVTRGRRRIVRRQCRRRTKKNDGTSRCDTLTMTPTR